MTTTRRARPRTIRTPQPQGEYVDNNRNYTIPGLCRALGVDQRVVREARANGLKAKLLGERRVIIRGADINTWLEEQAPDAPLPKGKSK